MDYDLFVYHVIIIEFVKCVKCCKKCFSKRNKAADNPRAVQVIEEETLF